MNIGSVFSQMFPLSSRGSARSARRESNGPEPSLGGGTSGRMIWLGDVVAEGDCVVDALRRRNRGLGCLCLEMGLEITNCCAAGDRLIDWRMEGGRAWRLLIELHGVENSFEVRIFRCVRSWRYSCWGLSLRQGRARRDGKEFDLLQPLIAKILFLRVEFRSYDANLLRQEEINKACPVLAKRCRRPVLK